MVKCEFIIYYILIFQNTVNGMTPSSQARKINHFHLSQMSYFLQILARVRPTDSQQTPPLLNILVIFFGQSIFERGNLHHNKDLEGF